MPEKSIAVGADHAGYKLKEKLKGYLQDNGYQIVDFGTDSDASVDYPDFAHPVSEQVASGKSDIGILICGSGNGVAMTANKHQKIRAALCWLPELGELARSHNKANILCLPGRFVSEDEAVQITKAYLEADFDGGRHQRRVDKIPC